MPHNCSLSEAIEKHLQNASDNGNAIYLLSLLAWKSRSGILAQCLDWRVDGRFCETCLVWVFWGQGEWQPNWAWRFLTAISAGVWFKKVAQGERAAFRVFEAICEWKLQSRLSTEGQMSLFQQCLKGEKWKKLRQKQASRNTFFSVVLFDGDGPRVFGVQFLCVVQHSTENSHQEQRYFKNKNPLCFNCVHWFKKIFFF